MNPDVYEPVHQTAVAFHYHRELLGKAIPDPADTTLFNRLMAEARAQGMTWMDGLEYVIHKRRSLLN